VLARVIDGAAAVGSRLPVRIAHGLAVVGGHLEWALRPGKRCILAANLMHAASMPAGSPQLRRLVRREVVNEARRSADLLWAIGRPAQALGAIEVVGLEHLEPAISAGQGVVLAGLHLGGWEVAAAVPHAVLPIPTTVVVADDWLAWAMQHVRATSGLRVIYRHAPALSAAHVLTRGEALLVLGEDASGAAPRTHLVDFCDARAHLPAGIASLSRIAGAAIVPFSVLPEAPRRWRVTVEPAIAPPTREGGTEAEACALQQLADRWSALLRAHPAQWAASFPIAWEPRP
jgi:lauroyl/myristoyl acyltransferase